MPDSAKKLKKRAIDRASLAGLVVALVGIIGGLLLEGGRLGDITQLTAAMIVLGGTFGAVMVTTPMPVLTAALKSLPSVFWIPTTSSNLLLQDILRLAAKARRTGIIALESDLGEISNLFFRKALRL